MVCPSNSNKWTVIYMSYVMWVSWVCVCVLPFCLTEHQMVTIRTHITVKTSSARTQPITAYGIALWASTTAPGSGREEKNTGESVVCSRHMKRLCQKKKIKKRKGKLESRKKVSRQGKSWSWISGSSCYMRKQTLHSYKILNFLIIDHDWLVKPKEILIE